MIKSQFKVLLQICLLCLTVSACTTTATTEDSDQETDPSVSFTAEQKRALLAMLEERHYQSALLESWQESQPGVRRLLAIETELKLLIEQLNKMAVTDQATPASDEQEKARSADEEESRLAAQDNPVRVEENENTLTGMYGVQLAAMDEIQKLGGSWKQLSANQPALLGELTPRYEQVSTPAGSVYRLKAGEFTAREEAEALCAKLQRENVPCLVTQYGEDAISLPH